MKRGIDIGEEGFKVFGGEEVVSWLDSKPM